MAKDYPNSGALFKNDRVRKDTDPGYTGSADIACPKCGGRFEFYLNAWVRAAKSGAKFFSLSFKPKGAPRQTNGEQPAASNGEIPF